MKFDELDKRMRIYETAHDHQVLPGIYMVARLDGRGFSSLTKQQRSFQKPFDLEFRDMLIETAEHLMQQQGFSIVYGYAQSDEMSFLFARHETTFSRKLRKLNSILAGEASAKFSLLLGQVAVFDCRISQLPTPADVVDYFRWRAEDAQRNALHAHCYWCLRKDGLSYRDATETLHGLSTEKKKALLEHYQVAYETIPVWQRRGCGLYWKEYDKVGFNPLTGESTSATRRSLTFDTQLPAGDAYSTFLSDVISEYRD